jgi:hypothetical protein
MCSTDTVYPWILAECYGYAGMTCMLKYMHPICFDTHDTYLCASDSACSLLCVVTRG